MISVDTPGGPIKPPYPRVSVTATYTSTVAEEMVALLRRLHSLDVWNPHINDYTTSKVPNIIAVLQPKSPVRFSYFFPPCYFGSCNTYLILRGSSGRLG